MIYDIDNIFAKILRGEIPCTKVFKMTMRWPLKTLTQ